MTDTVAPLPHAPIAEKSIISVCFKHPGRIAQASAEGITEALHIPAHREIMEFLVFCRDNHPRTIDDEIDITLFVQAAIMAGKLDRMGGPGNVYDLFNFAIGASGWSIWGHQVRECFARRIALAGSKDISAACDSEEALKAVTDTLERMRKAVTAKTRSLNAKQACEDFIQSYVAAYENGDLPGTGTGIGEIDEITGGAKPGELWVVSGPSSSGKSVLMYQIGSQFLGEKKVVAIFSAELMNREIVGRLVCLHARVPYQAITTPREVTKYEMTKVQASVKAMAETRMWVDASGGQSIESISAESERIKDIEGQIDLIIVDYIQIIKGNRNKGDSREQEVASISSGLKQLAKKMNCPVVTGSQENDDGKTRESRAIEQDADVWLKITADGILLKKVRNGKRDQTINLALDGSKQLFRYFRPD